MSIAFQAHWPDGYSYPAILQIRYQDNTIDTSFTPSLEYDRWLSQSYRENEDSLIARLCGQWDPNRPPQLAPVYPRMEEEEEEEEVNVQWYWGETRLTEEELADYIVCIHGFPYHLTRIGREVEQLYLDQLEHVQITEQFTGRADPDTLACLSYYSGPPELAPKMLAGWLDLPTVNGLASIRSFAWISPDHPTTADDPLWNGCAIFTAGVGMQLPVDLRSKANLFWYDGKEPLEKVLRCFPDASQIVYRGVSYHRREDQLVLTDSLPAASLSDNIIYLAHHMLHLLPPDYHGTLLTDRELLHTTPSLPSRLIPEEVYPSQWLYLYMYQIKRPPLQKSKCPF